MSQVQQFTVNDGASTPVAQTFDKVKQEGFKTFFRNLASTLVRGAKTISHEIVLGQTPTAANRVRLRFVAPTEGTVNGSTVVLRESSAELVINYAPDAPEAERQAFYGMISNTLAHADVKDSAIKLYTLGQ